MSLRSLATGILRWFREYPPGTIFYLDANREETALTPPSDYADHDYGLFISRTTGLPYFVAVEDLTVLDGFGTSFGSGFGTS